MILGVAVGVIALAGIFLFGRSKLGTLVKGFVGLFVEDLTKTPEGAEAVYNQAIEKSQNDYNQANDTLQKVAGQLDTAIKQAELYKKRVSDAEQRAESFAKNGQFDKVELFAREREDLLEELEAQNEVIKELKPIYEEAKVINTHLEEKLVKLKKEKVRIVADLKRNKQLKSMYDDMDELKNTTNVDKLLDTVKTNVKETREQAVGARTVHNNKTSTKIQAATQEAKKLQSSDYAAQLKAKYAKNDSTNNNKTV